MSAKIRTRRGDRGPRRRRYAVTRSTGMIVNVAGVGAVVGGGYSGKDPEVDNAVQQEADMLSRLGIGPVEIRFNSDRESGGAHIKSDIGEGFNNKELGFHTGTRPVYPSGETPITIMDRFFKGITYDEIGDSYDARSKRDQATRAEREYVNSLPREIFHEVVGYTELLRNPSVIDSVPGVWKHDDNFFTIPVKSVDEGVHWIEQNYNPAVFGHKRRIK